MSCGKSLISETLRVYMHMYWTSLNVVLCKVGGICRQGNQTHSLRQKQNVFVFVLCEWRFHIDRRLLGSIFIFCISSIHTHKTLSLASKRTCTLYIYFTCWHTPLDPVRGHFLQISILFASPPPQPDSWSGKLFIAPNDGRRFIFLRHQMGCMRPSSAPAKSLRQIAGMETCSGSKCTFDNVRNKGAENGTRSVTYGDENVVYDHTLVWSHALFLVRSDIGRLWFFIAAG